MGLARALGPAWAATVILVVSEFGRTVSENGSAGTDHGHGTVLWVMGGAVRGRAVYGRWPGLGPGDLYEERDLAVTTDFREVIGAVLRGHFGLTRAQLESVFPNQPAAPAKVDRLIRT